MSRMKEWNKGGTLLPLLIFSLPFLSFGALAVYFAARGSTFAQPLETWTDVVALGTLGVVFFAVGLCATVCAVAGRTRVGRVIAAFLMAAHIGLLGGVFLVIGIFDPESIKGGFGAAVAAKLGWNPHFGAGAVAFVLCGTLMLSLTVRIYRATIRQLEGVGN